MQNKPLRHNRSRIYSMVLLTVFLLSGHAVASEPNWVEIPINPNPDPNRALFMDKNSIEADKTVSQQYDFMMSIQPTEQAITSGQLNEYSTMISSSLNCSDKQLTMKEARLYSQRFGKGELLEQETVNQTRVPDENAGDKVILEFVCGEKLNAQ